MPSKDPVNPAANAWMERDGVRVSSGPEKQRGNVRVEGRARPVRKPMSPAVIRLAARIGADPYELAERYPEDSVRRTQYPVNEVRNPDGTRTFKDVLVLGDDGRHALKRV